MLKEKSTLAILLGVFIVTELVDDLFDHLLGSSILHSVIQLIIFIGLFITVSKIFLNYHKKQIKELLPEELMTILKTIKQSEKKGILINQRKMRTELNITKPTLKKRINSLLETQLIALDKKGNNQYFKLTAKGNTVLK